MRYLCLIVALAGCSAQPVVERPPAPQPEPVYAAPEPLPGQTWLTTLVGSIGTLAGAYALVRGRTNGST